MAVHCRHLVAVFSYWTAALVCTSLVAAPPLPGVSDYTLRLTQFSSHFGAKAMHVNHAGDGSGDVYVSVQSGQIFRYGSQGANKGVFLDVAAALPAFEFSTTGSFTGLMYFDFHPDYDTVGAAGYRKIYTAQRMSVASGLADYRAADFGSDAPKQMHMVVGEWSYDPALDRVDPASYRQLMRLGFQPDSPGAADAHALGQIAFNRLAVPGDADYGNLYIAVGDSNDGNGVSPLIDLQMVQSTDNPFGKILRINPLQQGVQPYGVPSTNPFNDGGTTLDADGLAEEIFALGFRDPQTFTFARDNAGQPTVVAFDIGAGNVEEIHLVRPGGNYGWPRFEGLDPYDGSIAPTGPAIPPALHYGHQAFPPAPGKFPRGGAAAIIGGLVVTDPLNPGFENQVIFSDLVRGNMFHADYASLLSAEQTQTQAVVRTMSVEFNSVTGSMTDVLGSARGDARFGADEAGNVYVVSKQTSKIFRTGLVLANPFSGGLPGDVNLDGVVSGDGLGPASADDFAAFLAGWKTVLSSDGSLARWRKGDLNLDGRSSLQDFFLLREAFSSMGLAAPASSIVPEANAARLAVVAFLSLFLRRR